jgi:5-methylcytosine-specific restriction endonuclease McrA
VVKSHGSRGKYGSRWEKYSKAYLHRNFFCADPFRRHPGRLVRSEVVGHRIAFKDDERLKWNPENHYPLCSSCNSYQCAKFEGGFGHTQKASARHERSEPKAQAANEFPPSVYAPPRARASTDSDGEPTAKL